MFLELSAFSMILVIFVIWMQLVWFLACFTIKTRLETVNSSVAKNGHIARVQRLPVSVVLPIASILKEQHKLLGMLDSQTYPNYEVIIVFEKNLCSEEYLYSSKIQFFQSSVFPEQRSNKVSNLLLGLSKVQKASEILIFLDDDIKISQNFIENITGHVEKKPHSVVTSYRFVNEAETMLQHLLLLANNCVATFMNLPRWRCVWGGCFAFNRSLLDKSALERIWSQSISDDLDLTTYARKNDIDLVVTPEYMCRSIQFVGSYRELFQWGLRQFKLARFYDFRNFCDSIFVSVAYVICYLLTVLMLYQDQTLGLIILAIQVVTVLGIYEFFQRIGTKLLFYKTLVIVPFLPFIVLLLAITALTGEVIVWKDRQYHLKKKLGHSSL